MIQFLQTLTVEHKMITAGAAGLAALVADVATDIKGWEEVGVKALLLGALIAVVRFSLARDEKHKAEVKEIWEHHKADMKTREDAFLKVMETNTASNTMLNTLLQEQNGYYKTIVRTCIDQRLAGPKGPLP